MTTRALMRLRARRSTIEAILEAVISVSPDCALQHEKGRFGLGQGLIPCPCMLNNMCSLLIDQCFASINNVKFVQCINLPSCPGGTKTRGMSLSLTPGIRLVAATHNAGKAREIAVIAQCALQALRRPVQMLQFATAT